jgi:cytochrome c551/c552
LNKTMVAGACAFLTALLVAACSGAESASPVAEAGDGGGATVTPAGAALPCDVDAVLARSCRQCHGAPPSFGAPMPLLTLADLHADAKGAPGKKIYEQVGVRVHDEAAPMPQPPNARLSPADLAALDTWIAAGAPAGSAACEASDAGQGGPSPLSCKPDQLIRPTSKFAVTADPDLYVCYGFDTDASQKRHVIAGAPRIDNTSVVHHVLLYQADEAVSGTPQPCGAGGGAGWRLVTGWAPGGKNFEMPPEAGFAEEVGKTHWAVQIHYNNAQGLAGQVDETGYDLCTTDQLRANDADILATGTFLISIPPRSVYETTCELSFPEDYGKINVISSWAHMHKLGRAEYAKRVRSGQETSILDAPAYDFSTGAGAGSVNVDLAGGDTVRTMCRWQNGTDAAVKFGEATSDEMCFAFLTYYPKITVPKFSWRSPSSPLVSKCTSKTL